MSDQTDKWDRETALNKALKWAEIGGDKLYEDELLAVAEKFRKFLTGEGTSPEAEYRYFRFRLGSRTCGPYYRFRVGAHEDDAGAVERTTEFEMSWQFVEAPSPNPQTLAELEHRPNYTEVPADQVPLEIRQRP